MDLLLKIASLKHHYKNLGILIYFKNDTDVYYSYYRLRESKGKLDIAFSAENLSSLDSIVDIAKKIPTILCIQGTGVVHRLIDSNAGDVRESIPNLDPDDFLLQLSRPDPGRKLLALYRKEQYYELINTEEIRRISFYGITLGFVGIHNFIELFDKGDLVFSSGLLSITFNDYKAGSIKKDSGQASEKYFFADSERSSPEILALCSGLMIYTGQLIDYSKFKDIAARVKEHVAFKLSSYIIRGGGLGLLFLLLINFFFFDRYTKKLNQLQVETNGINALKKEILLLKDDLGKKKEFINQNYVPDKFAFAFYADRLASYAQNGIYFSELSICPVSGKTEKNKTIEFKGNILLVKGSSPDSEVFSRFMEKVNSAQWIEKVERQVYHLSNEKDIADFELEIIVNDAIE